MSTRLQPTGIRREPDKTAEYASMKNMNMDSITKLPGPPAEPEPLDLLLHIKTR